MNKAEGIGMWVSEYNEEETLRMVKEEGRQEGENLLASLINKLISLDELPPPMRRKASYGKGIYTVVTIAPFRP